MRSSVSRRRFIGSIIATGLAPQFIPARVRAGPEAPSNRVRLGHIGVGGQGTALLKNFLGVENAISVAVADPFRQRREVAGQIIKDRQGHAAKLYNNFRELLGDPSIDAVVIATPDHAHVPVGLEAIAAGKDLYIEKPLGLSLNQNRALLEACRARKRVFQYGTQQRSQELLKRGVEHVLNGTLGELQRIDVWAPSGGGGGSLEEIPVPEGLDYDLYIGPAPMRPCTKDRITSKGSYFCSDYSIGFIAGWGAHPLDIAIWGMSSDQAGPVTLEGTGEFATPNALFNTCTTWDIKVKFADGVAMRFRSHEKMEAEARNNLGYWDSNGTAFYGSKGWISLSRNGTAASNPGWFRTRDWPASAKRVKYSGRYYRSFADSVQRREMSIAPIEDAVRSDTLSHLSLLAIQHRQPVVWDPAAYAIRSPAELNARMSIPVRGAWKQQLEPVA